MEERNCRWSRPFGEVQGQLNNSLNGDGDDEERLSFEPGSFASAARHIVSKGPLHATDTKEHNGSNVFYLCFYVSFIL